MKHFAQFHQSKIIRQKKKYFQGNYDTLCILWLRNMIFNTDKINTCMCMNTGSGITVYVILRVLDQTKRVWEWTTWMWEAFKVRDGNVLSLHLSDCLREWRLSTKHCYFWCWSVWCRTFQGIIFKGGFFQLLLSCTQSGLSFLKHHFSILWGWRNVGPRILGFCWLCLHCPCFVPTWDT